MCVVDWTNQFGTAKIQLAIPKRIPFSWRPHESLLHILLATPLYSLIYDSILSTNANFISYSAHTGVIQWIGIVYKERERAITGWNGQHHDVGTRPSFAINGGCLLLVWPRPTINPRLCLIGMQFCALALSRGKLIWLMKWTR